MLRFLDRPVEGLVRVAMLIVIPIPTATTVALAATFTVDRTDDNPNTIQCTSAPIDCSLRGAIRLANLSPGADTIVLPADTYTLTQLGPNEDAALTGDLDIDGDLIIQGAGRDTTVIRADENAPLIEEDRVLDVFDATVEIHGVTIELGSQNSDGGGFARADPTSPWQTPD